MKKAMQGFVGSVVVAAAMSVLGTGCAATTDAEEPAESSDDALSARQLPGVAAVEIADLANPSTVRTSKTVGAPKTVARLRNTVKRLRAGTPIPRCLSNGITRLTFLDRKGASLATVHSSCDGFGYLVLADGRTRYDVRFDTEVVGTAFEAPWTLGDALWNVTEIDVVQPGSPPRNGAVSGDAASKFVARLDLDASPDASMPLPGLAPLYQITFRSGQNDVAYANVLAPPNDAALTNFAIVDPAAGPDAEPRASGEVTMDVRALVRALDGASATR